MYLCAEGLGENEYVSHDGRVWDDELVGLADGGGDAPDGAPRVHDCLAAGDGGSGLDGAVLEASHHQGDDDVALLLRHLGRDGQQHQHVVALRHAHGVKVAQHVGAGDLAWLFVRVVKSGDKRAISYYTQASTNKKMVAEILGECINRTCFC